MTKNEIVARWCGRKFFKQGYEIPLSTVELNYELLHEAWVKFRDLHLDVTPRNYSEYENICMRISSAITHQPITEAFDELVKGIEWYEQFKQK